MNDKVELVEVDIERDAALAAEWINAPGGPQMLQLMGMTVPNDFKTTAAIERDRIEKMVNDPGELIWMIAYEGKVIGLAGVHTVSHDGLPVPNTTMMIGDESMRGRGIGTVANRLRIEKLKALGYKRVYARALTRNTASLRMLQKLGFENSGSAYVDEDGLNWQNVSLKI